MIYFHLCSSMVVFFAYCEFPCVPVLISPALFPSWASRLSRCCLSVDCLWPLVQGMLSPAISPRCINNNSNYSHSNQSIAPASRGLSREQIDRHLKSHIDCVAKKNTHTHKHTLGWVWGGMGRQIVSLGRKIDVNEFGWLRKTSGIVSGQPFYGRLAVSLLTNSDSWIPAQAGGIFRRSFQCSLLTGNYPLKVHHISIFFVKFHRQK